MAIVKAVKCRVISKMKLTVKESNIPNRAWLNPELNQREVPAVSTTYWYYIINLLKEIRKN